MSGPTWTSDSDPVHQRPGVGGIGRIALRAAVLSVVVFGGLGFLLVLRVLERPVFGARRPWTPWITVGVCRAALRVIGLKVRHHGAPMERPGIMVANHASWLDIFTLNAAGPLYFVSKSEVARWPGIGWLARATGTVFVERDRKHARAQALDLENRLQSGHRLLLFPEGTSSDGLRVLAFKPTLFASLFSPELTDQWAQPVCVVYHAPDGADPRFYGWWGDMDFGSHLLQTLSARKHGHVDVFWLEATPVQSVPDRKALAAEMERAVRGSHPHGSPGH